MSRDNASSTPDKAYLEQLAGAQQMEAELHAYRDSTAQTPGRLDGWKFSRDEIQRGA